MKIFRVKGFISKPLYYCLLKHLVIAPEIRSNFFFIIYYEPGASPSKQRRIFPITGKHEKKKKKKRKERKKERKKHNKVVTLFGLKFIKECDIFDKLMIVKTILINII